MFFECAELLAAAQAEESGDRALNALLVALRPAILRAVGRYVAPPRHEDLAQELLIRVTHTYRAINPGGCARYFLTAVRHLVTHERKARRTNDLLSLAGRADPIDSCIDLPCMESPASTLERLEERETVRRILCAISSNNLRAVAVGLYICGYSRDELARYLGISRAALRQRLNRVHRLVRPALQELGSGNVLPAARPRRKPPTDTDHGTASLSRRPRQSTQDVA